MAKVSYSEALPIRAARFFMDNHFATRESRGRADKFERRQVDEPKDAAARHGIALFPTAFSPSILNWLPDRWQERLGRRRHTLSMQQVGTLWLEWPYLEAEMSKKWVLLVYGRSYVPEMMRLAKEMTETFSLEVHVKLFHEGSLDLNTYTNHPTPNIWDAAA